MAHELRVSITLPENTSLSTTTMQLPTTSKSSSRAPGNYASSGTHTHTCTHTYVTYTDIHAYDPTHRHVHTHTWYIQTCTRTHLYIYDIYRQTDTYTIKNKASLLKNKNSAGEMAQLLKARLTTKNIKNKNKKLQLFDRNSVFWLCRPDPRSHS
jgi:hypothetical protein